jgi:hypothetical protein
VGKTKYEDKLVAFYAGCGSSVDYFQNIVHVCAALKNQMKFIQTRKHHLSLM